MLLLSPLKLKLLHWIQLLNSIFEVILLVSYRIVSIIVLCYTLSYSFEIC